MKKRFNNLIFFGELLFHTLIVIYKFILKRYKDNIFVFKLFIKCLFVNTIMSFDHGRWHSICFDYKKRKIKIPLNTLISCVLYYLFNAYFNLDILSCITLGLFLDIMFFILKMWNFHSKKLLEKSYMESN